MNRSRQQSFLKGTFIAFTLLIATSMVYAAPSERANQQNDRYIVQFDSHENRNPAVVSKAGGKVTGGSNVDLLPVLFAEMPEEAKQGLENNPHVVSVEKDRKAEALGQTTPWGIQRVNADDVHTDNKGSSATDVSVIDTGVDYEHPDLADNYVDGYDFVNGNDDPMDDNGHGTHVAGTAAAVDNSEGVIGASPAADMYGVKVLDSDGYGYYSDIIAGIDWSVKGPDGEVGTEDDAEVISMSLGGSSGTSSLQDAVQNAEEKGSLVVAAAGNDGSGSDTVVYPAHYESVIAVAATDQNNDRASFSSTGPDVELSAPGVDVLSTLPGNDYAYYSGTSMATPHVSGVAALVYNSQVSSEYDFDGDGVWDNDEVRKKMDDTATDLGPDGRDDKYGYGLVNASAAVGNQEETKEHDLALTDLQTPSTAELGDTVNVDTTVENLGDYDENATVTLTDLNTEEVIGTKEITVSSGSSSTQSFNWDTSGADAGDHDLRASVTTESEESDTSNNQKTSTVTLEDPVHDVATVSVAGSDVKEGETADVNVTVENQGDYDESFEVVLETDATTDTTDDDYIVGSETVQLSPDTRTTLVFNWNTTGVDTGTHNLTATSGPVENESETGDNSASTTLNVEDQVHDLAVTSVDSPSSITESETANIDVKVENQGDYSESTTLTLTDQFSGEQIGSESISLNSGEATTYSFSWDSTGAEDGDHTFEAEAEPVSGESETSDNTGTSTTTVEARVHDLAVISVDSPSTATEGDTVTVDVNVENQGDFDESTDLVLTDSYDGDQIGSKSISLTSGSSSTYSFSWDTSGEAATDHTLEAEAVPVENEAETSDNTGSSTTTIEEQQSEPAMYVDSIRLEVNQKGKNYDARAYVDVVNEQGQAVKRASVTGEFDLNGEIFSTVTGETNGQGEAKLDSGKIKASGGDTFGFTVTDVQHPDYVYDPSLNDESSETSSVVTSGNGNVFGLFWG